MVETCPAEGDVAGVGRIAGGGGARDRVGVAVAVIGVAASVGALDAVGGARFGGTGGFLPITPHQVRHEQEKLRLFGRADRECEAFSGRTQAPGSNGECGVGLSAGRGNHGD